MPGQGAVENLAGRLGFSSWGIFFEGPVRKSLRSMLADVLDVEGSQFPFLTFVRKNRTR